MLINMLDKDTVDKYCLYLKCAGMLSSLTNESECPYINKKIIENTFCLAANAENLEKSDCSVNAKLGEVGIIIKTFESKDSSSMQKVADFSKDISIIKDKTNEEIILFISTLRNERILSTMRIYGMKKLIYHCIVREPRLIKICEYPLESIDMNNLAFEKVNNNEVLCFSDGRTEYSFNRNNNELYKRFDTKRALYYINTDIAEAPYAFLDRILSDDSIPNGRNKIKYQSVILPLFSDKGHRHVPEKSGLNQWNASGRPRDINEIYIPIPSWIHKCFPDFFPARDKIFDLNLPDGNVLAAKACQQGSKALMSNPNTQLGRWLLRDVIDVKEGVLLTYEQLQILGIDSVEVYKYNDKEYKIDFRSIGTYDKFHEECNAALSKKIQLIEH